MRFVQSPQSLCQFSLAQDDITPPVGIYHRMWGAATQDQATGIHRPLTASVMCFRSLRGPQAEHIVIALDHVLLWANEMQTLLEQLANDSGLSQEQLTVTFSHTHAAGLMGMERASLSGGDLIPVYLTILAERLALLINQVRSTSQTVSITYANGQCSLAKDRDYFDEDTQQTVCGFNPAVEADDTLLIARINAMNGQSSAIIVNYACHPTTLAWGNTLISPDFPGATCELVKEHTDTPCVFIQGASGDLGPKEGFVADTEVADRNGRQLGYAVLSLLESMPPPLTRYVYDGPTISGATIGTWSHQALSDEEMRPLRVWQRHQWTVDLPYREDLPTIESTRSAMADWQRKEQDALTNNDHKEAKDCRAMVERMRRRLINLEALPIGTHFPFPVTLLRIGEGYWLFVESEPYSYLQTNLRERFPDVPIIVATLTNGSRPSYLPTKDAYGQGIYQETISVLACGSLEFLVEAIAQQIELFQ